jgi:hypothetical protein
MVWLAWCSVVWHSDVVGSGFGYHGGVTWRCGRCVGLAGSGVTAGLVTRHGVVALCCEVAELALVSWVAGVGWGATWCAVWRDFKLWWCDVATTHTSW